ncbi:MAG: hypothetical protein E5Y15_03515 [Mesorhizobium sp.]|nr:MAG: hypothetical protein E5Y15_03515 [Mesorhizobium sp.]
MFDRVMGRIFARHDKSAVLAKFQINMGMLEPRWERLTELNIERRQHIAGRGEQEYDFWHFVFETRAFFIAMNPSSHILSEKYSRARVTIQAGRKLNEPDFEPLSDRFWHRQIDALRAMMPELDELFPSGT